MLELKYKKDDIMEVKLPLCNEQLKKIDFSYFLNDLLDAIKYLSIYETKIKDNYLAKTIYLPALEVNEVRSSLAIEGTHTKIEDYYQEQLSPDKNNIDIKEVNNYRAALNKGTRIAIFEGFNNENICRLHSTLFENSSLSKKGVLVGAYKKRNNYIGRDNSKIYDPPKVEETEDYMNDLIAFMNNEDSKFHPLIRCAVMHAQFESIHPFEDGNGRVGRLLIPIYLCKSGIIDAPLFYISEAIDKDKYLYYSSLTATRDGNYNEWIKYFLQKCIIQSKKHIDFLEKINELYLSITKDIEEITNSVITRKLVDTLFRSPIINSKKMAGSLDISISQANRYLKLLVKYKILYENDKRRNTSYYFGKLLEIIS